MGCVKSKNKAKMTQDEEELVESQPSVQPTKEEKKQIDKRKAIKKDIKNIVSKNKIKQQYQKRVKEQTDPVKDPNQELNIIMSSNLSSLKKIKLKSTPLHNEKMFSKLDFILRQTTILDQISLVSCSLQSFPGLLVSSSKPPFQLLSLQMTQNHISQIPSSFSNNQCLQFLDLSYNQIQEIPACFYQLPILQQVDLSKNKITRIHPEAFKGKKQLIFLNLSSNLISEIQNFLQQAPKLEFLALSFNQITQIPSSFPNRDSNLISLRLNNNPLTKIAENISQLKNLQKLDLRSTNLTKLPRSLPLLVKLKDLSLNNTVLQFPPMYKVVKGLQEILKFIRQQNEKNPLSTEIDIPIEDENINQPKQQEKNIEIWRGLQASKAQGKQQNNNRTQKRKITQAGFKAFKRKATQMMDVSEKDVMILDSEEYVNAKQKLREIKEPICEFIKDICREESNPDKVILSIQSVLVLINKVLSDLAAKMDQITIPVTTGYFIGRIGNYKGSVSILEYIGFKLFEKPFHGLYLKMKIKNKLKGSQSSEETRAKDVKDGLDLFLEEFKAARFKELFQPDFEFFNYKEAEVNK